MINAPDVDALLAGELGQWLQSQTAMRREAQRKIKRATVISLCIAGALFILIFAFSRSFGAALFGGILAAGAGQLFVAWIRDPVVKSLKQQMNGEIAAALDCTFVADAAPGEEFELAKRFDLLPGHDKAAFEDEWHGTIGDGPFRLFEAHLEEWRGSGKNRRLETVFRGVLMTVGFARRFLGTTLIEREGNRITLFGLRDSITVDGQRLEQVKMVDPRFEDEFTIWTSDQVEARYLVHPAYVERLMAIEEKFAGRKIRALFHGGDLVIALESQPLFESGSIDPANDRARMAATIEQITSLANLAIALNERPRA